jgi:type VI secretion system secreted protein VgrG
MAAYTQANRPMRVDTGLGEDVLLLSGFNGHEGVSQLFGFQLDMYSLDAEIEPEKLLREPVTVSMNLPGDEKRLIHGLISRLTQLGKQDDLMNYRAEIVPWLWFLRLARGSRIFQELSVPDILEKVFSDAGYRDFEFRLTRSYTPRLYCVQYRETHLDFVSRLMEDEGIFYFFEHFEDKHVLVLCDDNGSTHPAPAAETARFTADASRGEEVINDLEREHSVHAGKITVSDYDYLQPSLNLEASLGDDKFELYDYPGSYADKENGERLAALLLEAEEAERQVLRGEGNVRGLIAGYKFTLTEHFRRDANTTYLITHIQHYASAGGFRSREQNSPIEYHNDFQAIPDSTPFRAPRRTPRPLIVGSQSALVVGPAGEEVHVDKHGRVKVHFYWDRDSRKDEHSSCWIRVTTPWGGKGWGAVSIPRIGNEVLVAFEEGDPDRPIIIGSLYNGEQTPPFELPDAGIQMGMKSRSSPGGGGMNEFTMTDTKGKEKITIHGQFDMDTTVENDQTNTVNNNRTTTIAVNDTESVGSNQTISVGANQSSTVSGDQTTGVDGKRDITVGGDQTIAVGGNEAIDVGGDRTTSIGGKDTVSAGGDQTIDVGANQTISVSANGELTVGANHTIDAGANIKINAGAKIEISAGAMITLEAGGSKIEIGPAGVTIQTGAIVNVQGSVIKLN